MQLNRRRNYGLDILRAAAVLFVMASHGVNVLMASYWPRIYLDIVGFFGFVGVELFFALSGFLVGGILIRAGEELSGVGEVWRFWGRRWFRTLPNYYFYLLLHFVLAYPLTKLGLTFIEHGKYFIFSQALVGAHPPFFAEAWSLAIEEWYYLLSPLILWGLLKGGLKFNVAFVVTVMTMLIVPLSLRTWLAATYPELGIEIQRKLVFLRLDSIMYGMVIAMVHQVFSERLFILRWWLLSTGLALLIGAGSYQFFGGIDINTDFCFKVVILAIVPLASALLIPYALTLNGKKDVIGAFFRTTALLSYSLYLCNLLMISYTVKYFSSWLPTSIIGGLLAFMTFVVLSYGTAYLTYRYIEKPMLSLRDRILPERIHSVRLRV